MKAMPLCVVLSLATSIASAATLPTNPSWAALSRYDDPKNDSYSSRSFDQNSIERTGDHVAYWEQAVHDSPQHHLRLVILTRYVADCDKQQLVRTASAVSDNTGAISAERVIEKSVPEKFDGVHGVIAKFVCTIGK